MCVAMQPLRPLPLRQGVTCKKLRPDLYMTGSVCRSVLVRAGPSYTAVNRTVRVKQLPDGGLERDQNCTTIHMERTKHPCCVYIARCVHAVLGGGGY